MSVYVVLCVWHILVNGILGIFQSSSIRRPSLLMKLDSHRVRTTVRPSYSMRAWLTYVIHRDCAITCLARRKLFVYLELTHISVERIRSD